MRIAAAERIKIWAVYSKFMLMHSLVRRFIVAFPSKEQADEWVKSDLKAKPWRQENQYMIEEMDATMKAWNI